MSLAARLCAFLLLTVLGPATAGAAPLAGMPSAPPEAAAAPLSLDDLPFFHLRRLRLAGGLTTQHAMLRNPGGNSVGLGISAVLERRRDEFGLSMYSAGGIASEDPRGRNTGLGGAWLRGVWRVVPVPGSLRVMLEAGVQGGYDRAYAFCVDTQCEHVPGRFSAAAVLGTALHLRANQGFLTLGFDVLVRGPRPPPPLSRAPLALQLWAETGFGGLNW